MWHQKRAASASTVYVGGVANRNERIMAGLERVSPGNARYYAFVDLFAGGRFFEAHEVLEVLWLGQRAGPEGDFYKGLIQFAGAFVHVQKGRTRPAGALLRLARANLGKFGTDHLGLNVKAVLESIEDWLGLLARKEMDPGLVLPGFPVLVVESDG